MAELSNEKSRRIQALRGVAILAVVMIHTYPHDLFGVYFRALINFAVAMFIFLSGYLTKLECGNWKEFYARRLKRVVIPYVFWSIVITVLKGNYQGFFINLLTGKCLMQYYFIIVYIQFILLTPLITRLLRSKISWGGWIIQPLSLILLTYLRLEEYVPLSLCTSWFSAYYLGLAIGNGVIRVDRISKARASLLWILALALNIAEGLFWFKAGDYSMATTQERLSNMLYSLACMTLAAFYIQNGIPFRTVGRKIEEALAIIGDCSFGIYLTHTIVLNVLEVIPVVKLIPFPINAIMAVALASLGIMLCRKVLGAKASGYLGF